MHLTNINSGYYNDGTNELIYIRFRLNDNEYFQLEFYVSTSKISMIYNNMGSDTIIWEIKP